MHWHGKNEANRLSVSFPAPDTALHVIDTNILISPASVDMGGVFITPLEKDFEKITANDIADILSEVCLKPADFRALIERIKQRS